MKAFAIIAVSAALLAAGFGSSDPWGAKKTVSNIVFDTPLPVYASSPDNEASFNKVGLIEWDLEPSGDPKVDLVSDFYSTLSDICRDNTQIIC